MRDDGIAKTFRRLPVAARVFVECVVLLALVGAAAGWFGKTAKAQPESKAPRPTTTTSPPTTTTRAPNDSLPTPTATAPTTTSTTISLGKLFDKTQSWQVDTSASSVDTSASSLASLRVTVTFIVKVDGFAAQPGCFNALTKELQPNTDVFVATDKHHKMSTPASPVHLFIDRNGDTDVLSQLAGQCRNSTTSRPPKLTRWTISKAPFGSNAVVHLQRTMIVAFPAHPCDRHLTADNPYVWLPVVKTDTEAVRLASTPPTIPIDPSSTVVTPTENKVDPQRLACGG